MYTVVGIHLHTNTNLYVAFNPYVFRLLSEKLWIDEMGWDEIDNSLNMLKCVLKLQKKFSFSENIGFLSKIVKQK